jgi:hypothetical protein
VEITEKDNATERRSPTPVAGRPGGPDRLGNASLAQEQILDDQVQGRRPVSEQELQASMQQADEIARSRLGDDAATLPASTDSGTYRGEILGDTQHHLVQSISTKTAVAHPKDLLSEIPAAGDHVRITYSQSLARVAAFEPQIRSKSLAR